MSIYCPLPFNHTTISTKGHYDVCCEHKTPNNHRFHLSDGDFNAWQATEYCTEVKQYFTENKQHPGCAPCWDKEKHGRNSYRQRVLQEYKILGATNPPQQKLLNIEIAVGNLCNLSCLMCNEKNSSVILAENIKLKINQHTQKDFKWDEENFVALSKNLKLRPKVINLRGGEPLYNKKIFELLNSFDPEFVKDTVIHITTNATVWNQDWARILAKFKLVRMMFSIDAVGLLYNYIRHPGNFTQVEDNIKNIISYKNIKPLIHATVQNLNVLYLEELINWANSLGIYLELDAIDRPEYLHVTNLPPGLKSKSVDYLTRLTGVLPDTHIRRELVSYTTILQESVDDPALWEKFVLNISQRDQLRGNSFKEFLY